MNTPADDSSVAPTVSAVKEALAMVDDPCSIAARAPLNVLELGLIRDCHVGDDGCVHITVSPTAPSCVLIASIAEGIERRVAAVDGVTGVQVRIDTETIWLPTMMTDDGRAKLHRRRSGSRTSVPVRPRQWEAAVTRND
jgi:metal-sulfur cluster biosynthetic enzyme